MTLNKNANSSKKSPGSSRIFQGSSNINIVDNTSLLFESEKAIDHESGRLEERIDT